MTAERAALIDRAARPYRNCGRFAWHFARGKLSHDPIFTLPLDALLPARNASVLDLGCGQGLLLAWLHANGWSVGARLEGMELDPGRAATARRALDGIASIACCDLRSARFPRSDVVALIDVLFYMEHDAQERALDAAAEAVAPGGILLLREADADAGLRFRATRWAERLVSAARGQLRPQLHYRGRSAWQSKLTALGFSVEVQPASQGTPFSNVLYVCRRT